MKNQVLDPEKLIKKKSKWKLVSYASGFSKAIPKKVQQILSLDFTKNYVPLSFSSQQIASTSSVGASSFTIQNPPIVIPQISVTHTMAGPNPPPNWMDAIVAARYAPLVLPQPMNALPAGDYLKYMYKFNGEEE